MSTLTDAIHREAAALPPEFQHEVLDFIGSLRGRIAQKSDHPAWLERVWGAMPDFPDRPVQPSLADPP